MAVFWLNSRNEIGSWCMQGERSMHYKWRTRFEWRTHIVDPGDIALQQTSQCNNETNNAVEVSRKCDYIYIGRETIFTATIALHLNCKLLFVFYSLSPTTSSSLSHLLPTLCLFPNVGQITFRQTHVSITMTLPTWHWGCYSRSDDVDA